MKTIVLALAVVTYNPMDTDRLDNAEAGWVCDEVALRYFCHCQGLAIDAAMFGAAGFAEIHQTGGQASLAQMIAMGEN